MNVQDLISRRRTKIVCTIGPASSPDPMLRRLIRAGMDCARLNFSHGSHSEHLEVIRSIRRISEELGKQVALMQDLPGPKFRVGKLKNDPVRLRKGATIALATDKEDSDDELKIPLRQHDLPKYVVKGSTIFLSDGTIRLRVIKTTEKEIECKVLVGGNLFSGKGVNIPSLGEDFETFTDADREHVLFGLEHKVDFVAVSFVRNRADIEAAKAFIAKHSINFENTPWVIAKIEKRKALQNLAEIIDASDAVMVARGDLGVENPIEEVPIIQKRIIARCNSRSVPVITATQMLESMVQNASPTRAEVTDVANAILDGTDAVMLSEETAVGKYPQECVRVLHRVALNAETRMLRKEWSPSFEFVGKSVDDVASSAAIRLSQDVGARLFIAPTENGLVASRLARFKPMASILAITSHETTERKLKIVWGVNSLLARSKDGKGAHKLDQLLETSIRDLVKNKIVSGGDKLVVFCDSIEFFGYEGKLTFVTEAGLH
ncbi:MAG TPA: pyruvate kinase [Nitrososphaerales archaeon]|nr:pyruvate kinase [Nitrososphaerales archaeon]